MKIKFLIQSRKTPDNKYDVICHGQSFKHLTISAGTFDEGSDAMQLVLEQFMKRQGLKWIRKWKGFPGCVNCPDAYLELPSDICMCKITKEMCSIQAQIPIKDKTRF